MPTKDPDALAAYCAGIYEVTGSTYFAAKTIRKQGKVISKPQLVLRLIVNHIEIAKEFQDFVGDGIIHGPTYDYSKLQVWHYYLTNADKIVDVMIKLDCLTQYKKAEFDFAYEQYSEVKTHGYDT
jgi:hypothetical protein